MEKLLPFHRISLAILLASCGQASAQTSFWTSSVIPQTAEVKKNASATLGLKFYSDVPGSVTAVRFYKGTHNTGLHVGTLWSNTGTSLATVTFSGETASGWQQANFPSPVGITANVTYVISYLAPKGSYANDQSYPWSGLSAAPLHVSGSSPGVYVNGTGTAFPGTTSNGSNYWVDLIFVPAAASPTLSTYTISGKVSGSAATLTLSGAGSGVATTDSAGNYSFSGLSNGSYTIAASQPGFTFTPSTASVSVNGASITAVNFTAVATTYTISGKVSGSAATLTLSGAKSAVTTTDSVGNYSFSGLPNGSYTISASQAGYTFTPTSASVSINGAPITGVNFTAVAITYTISGKVSGSVATLTLSGTKSGTTTTDSTGNYSFAGLANGSYILAPSQSGYSFTPSTASVSINGASITGVNFTATAVPTTYTISGTVSGAAASLTLSGTSSGTTTTDSAGNYRFSGLANGSYVVAPSQSGYSFTPSTASVSINGASITGVNFTAAPAPVSHTVTLSWTASTSSNVVGYNLYRASVSGGPYAKLNASPVAATTFTDSGVAAGQTYFYVSTALDSTNAESAYSNEAAAGVPTP